MRHALLVVTLAGCGAAIAPPGDVDLAAPVADGEIVVADGEIVVADGAAPVADAAAPLADMSVSVPADASAAVDMANGCQVGMVRIGAFCIDRWEAHVVELGDGGVEVARSPFLTIGTANVRAKTAGGVMPQGYISQLEATKACANAGKRLCDATEFALACRGPNFDAGVYPYGGTVKKAGYCNEGKGSSLPRFYGTDPNAWTYAAFNDPRLNQWDGGLAPTGAYDKCASPEGVYDCVGNLHEWGSDPADTNGHGRFRGGFYGDAEINGKGCLYVTRAHALSYHDYSTGFRCCMNAL